MRLPHRHRAPERGAIMAAGACSATAIAARRRGSLGRFAATLR
jgi:hypothetical protein